MCKIVVGTALRSNTHEAGGALGLEESGKGAGTSDDFKIWEAVVGKGLWFESDTRVHRSDRARVVLT